MKTLRNAPFSVLQNEKSIPTTQNLQTSAAVDKQSTIYIYKTRQQMIRN